MHYQKTPIEPMWVPDWHVMVWVAVFEIFAVKFCFRGPKTDTLPLFCSHIWRPLKISTKGGRHARDIAVPSCKISLWSVKPTKRYLSTDKIVKNNNVNILPYSIGLLLGKMTKVSTKTTEINLLKLTSRFSAAMAYRCRQAVSLEQFTQWCYVEGNRRTVLYRHIAGMTWR